jgi:hypothetical protein
LDIKLEGVVMQIRISDLKKDILAVRIKQECWSAMADPGLCLPLPFFLFQM